MVAEELGEGVLLRSACAERSLAATLVQFWIDIEVTGEGLKDMDGGGGGGLTKGARLMS
jgi:hypothetical protein